MKRIRVLLCDDHAMVREGMRLLLETAEDIEVVGEATDGRQAVEEAMRLAPDVVLQDIAMPRLNGLEAARQIAREVPTAKVLMLSAYSDDTTVEKAIATGAAGYALKTSAGRELLQSIREVARGNAFFSPPIAKRLAKQMRDRRFNSSFNRPRANMLTGRQVQVLQLIAEGYANKQIADLLSRSIKTVEKHRQQLMNTLDLHDIASLTRYAISHRMVELNLFAGRSVTGDSAAVGWIEEPRERVGAKRTHLAYA